MSRFYFPPNSFRKGKGIVVAYFNFVDTETGLMYRDFRLMKTKKNTFAGSPFRSYENDEGEDVYVNFVDSWWNPEEEERDEDGVAWFEELVEAALDAYKEQAVSSRKEGKGKKTKGKGNSKKRGKRGAIAGPPRASASKASWPFDDDDDDDDDE